MHHNELRSITYPIQNFFNQKRNQHSNQPTISPANKDDTDDNENITSDAEKN